MRDEVKWTWVVKQGLSSGEWARFKIPKEQAEKAWQRHPPRKPSYGAGESGESNCGKKGGNGKDESAKRGVLETHK